MEKQRIAWIDMAKGIGIILVVLGHCFNKGTYLHNWIFSFHMPMFFILSGICFDVEKYSCFTELVKRKFHALIVPYVKFWIFALLVSLSIPYMRSGISINTVLVVLYSAWPGPINIGSIWYLVCLFVCLTIYWLLYHIGEKLNCKWFLPVMIILSALCGIAISILKSRYYDTGIIGGEKHNFLPGDRLPLTIDTAFTAIVFVALGSKFGGKFVECIVGMKNKVVILLVSSGVSIFVSLFFNTRVNLHGCTLGNPICFYICAFAGTLSIVLSSYCVCSSYNSFLKVLSEIFCFLGKNSLLMLGVQSFGIHFYCKTLNFLNGTNYVLYENIPVVHGLYMFFINLFVLFPVAYVINRKMPKRVRI